MCNLFPRQHFYKPHTEICLHGYDANDLCREDARASDCFLLQTPAHDSQFIGKIRKEQKSFPVVYSNMRQQFKVNMTIFPKRNILAVCMRGGVQPTISLLPRALLLQQSSSGSHKTSPPLPTTTAVVYQKEKKKEKESNRRQNLLFRFCSPFQR